MLHSHAELCLIQVDAIEAGQTASFGQDWRCLANNLVVAARVHTELQPVVERRMCMAALLLARAHCHDQLILAMRQVDVAKCADCPRVERKKLLQSALGVYGKRFGQKHTKTRHVQQLLDKLVK